MHYGYPKIGVFGGFRGKNSKFYFSRPQKALPYAETRLLTYCAWKSVQRCGLYPSWRTAKKKKRKNIWVYISRICRGKPVWAIFTKTGLFHLPDDLITPSKFGQKILNGFWSAGVQSLGPPIYCVHRSYKQAPAIAGVCDPDPHSSQSQPSQPIRRVFGLFAQNTHLIV